MKLSLKIIKIYNKIKIYKIHFFRINLEERSEFYIIKVLYPPAFFSFVIRRKKPTVLQNLKIKCHNPPYIYRVKYSLL